MLWPGVSFLLAALVTGLALSMDALAVSIAAGLARSRARTVDALKMAVCFGGFQAAMPLLGALLGEVLRPLVERFAPILAGIVLVGLGLYAARESLGDEDERRDAIDFFAWKVMLGLGLATSLDAFAVGVSLGLAGTPLLPSVAIIGTTTFTLSFAGVMLAERIERLIGSRAELVGGLGLALLGLHMIVRALT